MSLLLSWKGWLNIHNFMKSYSLKLSFWFYIFFYLVSATGRPWHIKGSSNSFLQKEQIPALPVVTHEHLYCGTESRALDAACVTEGQQSMSVTKCPNNV